jgi:hypothetical protein
MDKDQEAKVTKALQTHEARLKKLEAGMANLSESSTPSSDLAAQLKEEAEKSAQLSEQVTLLEQENAALKERSDALAVLEELVKTPEGFAEMAAKFGYTGLIPQDKALTDEANREASAAEPPPSEGRKPSVVAGKVDDPDYEYLPGMDASILKPKAPKEE